MTYQELQDALGLFGLGERATLKQIKARHRVLAKMLHPDRNSTAFSEAEFLEQRPEERLRRQFGWDPVWSGKPE
jgi:hypothetical protein